MSALPSAPSPVSSRAADRGRRAAPRAVRRARARADREHPRQGRQDTSLITHRGPHDLSGQAATSTWSPCSCIGGTGQPPRPVHRAARLDRPRRRGRPGRDGLLARHHRRRRCASGTPRRCRSRSRTRPSRRCASSTSRSPSRSPSTRCVEGSPAQGRLKAGDVVVTVDGTRGDRRRRGPRRPSRRTSPATGDVDGRARRSHRHRDGHHGRAGRAHRGRVHPGALYTLPVHRRDHPATSAGPAPG